MVDVFYYYVTTLLFIGVLLAFLCVYRYFLGNRLNKQADKLKSQMMNIRRDFPELQSNPKEFIGKTISSLGVDGILNELGIDPSIIKNPIVKGLIDRYAPKVLEQLNKTGSKGNVNENEGF